MVTVAYPLFASFTSTCGDEAVGTVSPLAILVCLYQQTLFWYHQDPYIPTRAKLFIQKPNCTHTVKLGQHWFAWWLQATPSEESELVYHQWVLVAFELRTVWNKEMLYISTTGQMSVCNMFYRYREFGGLHNDLCAHGDGRAVRHSWNNIRYEFLLRVQWYLQGRCRFYYANFWQHFRCDSV